MLSDNPPPQNHNPTSPPARPLDLPPCLLHLLPSSTLTTSLSCATLTSSLSCDQGSSEEGKVSSQEKYPQRRRRSPAPSRRGARCGGVRQEGGENRAPKRASEAPVCSSGMGMRVGKEGGGGAFSCHKYTNITGQAEVLGHNQQCNMVYKHNRVQHSTRPFTDEY